MRFDPSRFSLALLASASFWGPTDARAADEYPLVLNDGQVVSVRVLDLTFEPSAAALTEEGLSALQELGATLDPECYLTAQAIGHVESDVAQSDDAFEPHRLARARADHVQATMVEMGFSKESIASVWDWQFNVMEPRVTLWVFARDPDAGCDQPVENAPSFDQPAAEAPAGTVEPEQDVAEAPLEPEVQALEAEEPTQTVIVPEEKADPPQNQFVAVPRPTNPTSTDPEAPGEDPPATGETLAVQTVPFAVNSSYFDAQTGRELRSLINGLEDDARYHINLLAAVGSGDVQGVQSDTEAERYNRWIAERRVERVTEWFNLHKGNRSLDFSSRYNQNDPSRSVVVAITPAN